MRLPDLVVTVLSEGLPGVPAPPSSAFLRLDNVIKRAIMVITSSARSCLIEIGVMEGKRPQISIVRSNSCSYKEGGGASPSISFFPVLLSPQRSERKARIPDK